MTPGDLATVARLCAERAGLEIDPDKPYLIESRLAPLARREGFASTTDLVGSLETEASSSSAPLAAAVAEAMGSSETSFFRDPQVFETLWRDTVPELARRRAEGVVRVWSAGCASGQEIYSLAMLQAEAPAAAGPVELFASDYSERLLERARAGVYSSFEVQRGLSARRLVRHFENHGDGFQLAGPLRQAVRWRHVNLMDDVAALGPFDMVLCRNVLIGMTPGARADVLRRLRSAVGPGGFLVLGSGEDAGDAAGFQAVPGLRCAWRRSGEGRAAA
jgi:chemotaxis protein methyltransferase CheR